LHLQKIKKSILSFQKVIKILGFSICLLCLPSLVGAQSATDKRKELELKRKELSQKIAETKKVIAETQTKQKVTLSQLKVIANQIKTREEVIRNYQSEIEQVDLQISDARKTIDTLKNDLARLKEEYARSVRGAYKARNVYDKMMYVFASKDFNQALKRLRYLNQYTEYRIQQAELIHRTQKEVITALEKLLSIKQEKLNLVQNKKIEKKELEEDKKQESKVLTKLQERESVLKRQLSENQKAAKKLNKAIEDLIAKEIEEARKREEARRKAELAKAAKDGKAAPAESKSSSTDLFLTPEVLKISSDFEKNKNNLPWPVEKGYISERYGTHPHPTIKGAMINNNGVNITTAPNTQVKAVFGGKVKFIRSIPGMGTVVLIGHGRYYTAYAKLGSVSVKEGQQVGIRDVIGSVMTDEEENITEVHFEIWNMDKKEDPENWLKNK
jgi:septal ring factor EnvC (AmiA/AmiB activator)